ncbi:MAG: hypothetical protein LBP79_03940 [Clostridiales bacterium]|jgi:hypothetical protein|nr:hypothetical protein [Clostridiales bacterium]
MTVKTYAEYSDTYYGRVDLGVKSHVSFLIQIAVIAASAVSIAVFLPPILRGGAFDIASVAVLGVSAAVLLIALIRAVFWIAYPKRLIAVEPGRVILFPGKRRETVLPRKDIISVRQSDWWGGSGTYNNHAVVIVTKYGGRYKLNYVASAPSVIDKLRRVRRDIAA